MNIYSLLSVFILLLTVGAYWKEEWLVTIVMRSVLGILGMYFLDVFLFDISEQWIVEINEISILTCGMFGFPGFLVLFGMKIGGVL